MEEGLREWNQDESRWNAKGPIRKKKIKLVCDGRKRKQNVDKCVNYNHRPQTSTEYGIYIKSNVPVAPPSLPLPPTLLLPPPPLPGRWYRADVVLAARAVLEDDDDADAPATGEFPAAAANASNPWFPFILYFFVCVVGGIRIFLCLLVVEVDDCWSLDIVVTVEY